MYLYIYINIYIYIYLWIIRVGGAVKYTTYVRKRAVYPARKGYTKGVLIDDPGIIQKIRNCTCNH